MYNSDIFGYNPSLSTRLQRSIYDGTGKDTEACVVDPFLALILMSLTDIAD